MKLILKTFMTKGGKQWNLIMKHNHEGYDVTQSLTDARFYQKIIRFLYEFGENDL